MQQNSQLISISDVVATTLALNTSKKVRTYCLPSIESVESISVVVFPLDHPNLFVTDYGDLKFSYSNITSSPTVRALANILCAFGYKLSLADEVVQVNTLFVSLSLVFVNEAKEKFKVLLVPLHTGNKTKPDAQLNYLDHVVGSKTPASIEDLYAAIAVVQKAAQIFNSDD